MPSNHYGENPGRYSRFSPQTPELRLGYPWSWVKGQKKSLGKTCLSRLWVLRIKCKQKIKKNWKGRSRLPRGTRSAEGPGVLQAPLGKRDLPFCYFFGPWPGGRRSLMTGISLGFSAGPPQPSSMAVENQSPRHTSLKVVHFTMGRSPFCLGPTGKSAGPGVGSLAPFSKAAFPFSRAIVLVEHADVDIGFLNVVDEAAW